MIANLCKFAPASGIRIAGISLIPIAIGNGTQTPIRVELESS
jgi:hypothetical protein